MEPQIDGAPGERRVTGKAVEDAGDVAPAFTPQRVDRVVVRLARMDHYRPPQLAARAICRRNTSICVVRGAKS